MINNVTTSNGIVWSLDNTKMYYIDTPTQKVMQWDYDNETGEITNPKTAVEVPGEMGYPDGMTIDAEGNLWVALWGGSAVSCWNPVTGELLRTIEVPAKMSLPALLEIKTWERCISPPHGQEPMLKNWKNTQMRAECLKFVRE